MYKTIALKNLSTAQVQHYLQHAIAPRPICFAATIDKDGNENLSPFSFFNLFSCNPPIVIFSPARRLRDNTTKHTLQNVLEVPEVVINIVSYDMVQQVSLSSCDYAKPVDEFIKAGFTKEPSQLIQPSRVKESPVQLECKVIEIKTLGNNAGAGNLIIAEVLVMHIKEAILDNQGMMDQQKLNLVARLGNNWYTRVNTTTIFEVDKPNMQLGIGMDALPKAIRQSNIFTANNLAQLANIHEMPVIDSTFNDERLKNIIQYYSLMPIDMEKELHLYAKELLDAGKVDQAWQILLTDEIPF